MVGTDHAWERALELAWEAFCGGTTPVGAVVTDAAGGIVAAWPNSCTSSSSSAAPPARTC